MKYLQGPEPVTKGVGAIFFLIDLHLSMTCGFFLTRKIHAGTYSDTFESVKSLIKLAIVAFV